MAKSDFAVFIHHKLTETLHFALGACENMQDGIATIETPQEIEGAKYLFRACLEDCIDGLYDRFIPESMNKDVLKDMHIKSDIDWLNYSRILEFSQWYRLQQPF